MKGFKIAAAILVALMLVGTHVPYVSAEQDQGKSITITLDRRTVPQSMFRAGRFFVDKDDVTATVTVFDHAIRDRAGTPIDGFTIQTASGQTKVPIETVKEIRFTGWVHRRTDDIELVEHVTEADILLTNGTEKNVLMSADFGTIEGKTERGDFFLGDSHTVRHLLINR